MLLRINILTFSRAVPKKSAINSVTGLPKFSPFPSKPAVLSPSLYHMPHCDWSFAFATGKSPHLRKKKKNTPNSDASLKTESPDR